MSLLHHLPDLAADLPAAEAAAARSMSVPALTVSAGRLDLQACRLAPRLSGSAFALLVVESLLVRTVELEGQRSCTLHGPGTLLGLTDDDAAPLGTSIVLSCPNEALIALLDDRTLRGMQRWPRMIPPLVALMTHQLEQAEVMIAASQLPRVEDRLLALFWRLAERWGRYTPDGIIIDQPLTHEMIGRLVGGRRPTVSLGLQALAERELLERMDDGTWRLDPASADLS